MIARPDVYIPYDVQKSFRTMKLGIEKLFPKLNALALKDKADLDLNLLTLAYKGVFSDLSAYRATESFIKDRVLGKENEPCDHVYDVTGSLCENNDKFAIDRALPRIDKGDYIVIHDTGAHGFAMGYNYNGRLWSAELLKREDGSIVEIRRAQTIEDYFATLDGFWDVTV